MTGIRHGHLFEGKNKHLGVFSLSQQVASHNHTVVKQLYQQKVLVKVKKAHLLL